MRAAVRAAALLVVGCTPFAASAAQAAGDSAAAARECYGVAFGAWTPPLDAKAAGHSGAPVDVGRTPEGREWAVDGRGTVTMMLFPSWWPAGVDVRLSRPLALGDTVTGEATALVADGRVRPPTAPVRAWRVPCAARPPARPADSVPPARRGYATPKPNVSSSPRLSMIETSLSPYAGSVA